MLFPKKSFSASRHRPRLIKYGLDVPYQVTTELRGNLLLVLAASHDLRKWMFYTVSVRVA